MAEYYCDPSLPISGAYNSAPVAAGTTPTKPDEGDGKASGTAAKASGTITIGTNLNSGDTISFNGKTFTAGTDFTIGASAAATATNLASAINALTATSTWTVGNGYQFRDLFNACVSSNVVTVHTRIGSADWNSVTIATSSGGRATVSGFSGGASGAFGWVVNSSSLAWPSGSKAAGAYGLLVSEFVGRVLAAGDIVNVRCGNGTASTTITLGSVLPVFLKRGTPTAPVIYNFDDGTVWTADAGLSAVLTIQLYNSSTQYANLGYTTNATSATDGGIIYAGTRYSNGNANFCLQYAYGNNGNTDNCYGQFYLGTYVTWRSVDIQDARTSGSSLLKLMLSAYDERHPMLIDCNLTWGHSWTSNNCFEAPGNQHVGVEMIGGKCGFSNISSAPTGAFFYNISASYNLWASFKGVEFTGLVPGCLFVSSNDSTGYERYIEVVDCDGIHNFNWLHSASVVRNSSNNFPRNRVAASGIKGNGYIIDTPKMNAAWLPGLGFPYLNGIVEENQPAAIRAEHSVNSKYVNLNDPATLLDTLVYNAATSAAAKTLTLQLAIDENLTFDTSNLAIHVTYQDDTTGKTKYITSRVSPNEAASLTTSSETWYPEDGGRPYYTETVAKYYNKKKLAITTPTTVKATSMMRVWLTVHTPNTATGRYIFIDPYVQVS